MREYIDELMNLSALELNKRTVSTFIALLENNMEDKKLKGKMVKKLPKMLKDLNKVSEYYDKKCKEDSEIGIGDKYIIALGLSEDEEQYDSPCNTCLDKTNCENCFYHNCRF